MSGPGVGAPRLIVKATPSRLARFGPYLKRVLPARAEYCVDTDRNAMTTFLAALRMAGEDAVVHMEDDIILTCDFDTKLCQAVAERPNEVIQFFGRSKKDIELGCRHKPGSSFLMNQCTYFPASFSYDLREYYRKWPRRYEAPTGTDFMVADFLKSRGMSYWLHAPSLVDHRVGVSEINPLRPRKRCSSWFVDPDFPTPEEEATA